MALRVRSASVVSSQTENSLSRTMNMTCPPNSASSVALAGAGMNSFRNPNFACSGGTF